MSQYREPTSTEALKTIARQAIRISRLETDNAALRAKRHLRATERHLEDESSAGAGAPQISVDDFETLSRKYADLKARYASLSAEHEGCIPQIQEAQKKWREAKQSIKAWKQYLDEKAEYSKLRQQKDAVAPHPPPPTLQTTMPLPRQSHEGSPNLAEPIETPRREEAVHVPLDVPSSPLQSCSRSRVHRVSSSQTTIEEIGERETQVPKAEPDLSSDNEPVFVSARSLKRKAEASVKVEPPRRRIKQEPNSLQAAIELTSEDCVNTPRTIKHSIRSEQSDLDTVGPPVITPHRSMHLNNLYQRAVSLDPERPAPKLTRTVSSFSKGNRGGQTIAPILALRQWMPNAYRRQMHAISATSVSGASLTSRGSAGALQPISVNVPWSSRSTEQLQKTKPGTRRAVTRDKNITFLSEDGDYESSQLNQAKPQDLVRSERLMAPADTDHRLDDLLNGSTHRRTPILPGRAVEPASTARRSRPPPYLPTPVSKVEISSLVKRRSPSRRQQPTRLNESPPPVRPEDEPLRIRDRSTLRLEDFKINPSYLGTDFAFADTLRGRDARKGLHTCARPDCCGDALGKAIAMGGTSLSGKTDTEALEAFLGPHWADHIGTYGPDKRKEVVQQAHVYCFSNQHGKHRQAFARRSTPPGFWDTDFPNTQETAKYREQAHEMVRSAIEERWREAIRDGGRWIFRDE